MITSYILQVQLEGSQLLLVIHQSTKSINLLQWSPILFFNHISLQQSHTPLLPWIILPSRQNLDYEIACMMMMHRW